MDLIKKIEQSSIQEKHKREFKQFYTAYKEILDKSAVDPSLYESTLDFFLERLKEQAISPYEFKLYHEKVRKPLDFYQFGLDFMSPLVDKPTSSLQGEENLQEIKRKLAQGENVIFFANHQIEADPQVISILLEKDFPELAEEMISVAGERVIIDPLAAPFSRGRNLLCIYSKRYIDNPPELKEKRQLHNKKTMELMCELLKQGGHAIYVAPSGGRDRKDNTGTVQVSSFDPRSIEMFYLMAKKAKTPTSFYPMALATYHLLPPPDTIKIEIGEVRKVGKGAAHLWVGKKISMENFPGSMESDKKKNRELRAEFIWNEVNKAYKNFPL